MNNCFENYITLEGLSPSVVSRSGLYINDLPGVTLDMFEGLVKSDQSDVLDFWNRLYKRGKANFIIEVTKRINNSFYLEKVIESQISGSFNENHEINDTVEIEAGVRIEFLKSKYSTTEIQTLVIYSAAPVTTTLVIQDAVTSEELLSKEVELEDGENTIDIFKSFANKKIKILYNPAEVASYKTGTYKDDINWFQSTKSCSDCSGYGSASISQINGGGLIVEYVTKCSVERFICSRLDTFKQPFWYWLGVELMKDRVTSENTNCFTIDREKAKELLGFYETEFMNIIDPLLKDLKVKDDSICFDCKGVVTKLTSLP
jgi:hypothetical protein